MRPTRHTVPVNLVADGRPAFVAGYGKVGRRKVAFLSECGVDVVVVSPDAPCATEGGIEFIAREFRETDCEGKMVVFACTDDKHVNRSILEAARKAGVPCCCSDMNWADGDFVTPAVTRFGDATVAISTSGASCSNAKALRQSIGEFLKSKANGRLAVIGTDDTMLDSRRRAPLHLDAPGRAETLKFILALKGVEGAVVLNTCNRVEAVVDGDADAGLLRKIMGFGGLGDGEFFVLEGREAFRHIVNVTAGMKSAWVGEFHIVKQVKDALDESAAAGGLNGRLKGIFDEVLRISKNVRHATAELLDVKEIETTAVDYLSRHIDPETAKICILGSGKLGTSVAEHLCGKNVRIVHHGEEIPACDALVCALSAPEPVVRESVPGRIVLDLGMPPNCSPEAGAVSLDELKDWRRMETGAADEAAKRAAAVIDMELQSMEEEWPWTR